jgi:hypothetical protein
LLVHIAVLVLGLLCYLSLLLAVAVDRRFLSASYFTPVLDYCRRLHAGAAAPETHVHIHVHVHHAAEASSETAEAAERVAERILPLLLFFLLLALLLLGLLHAAEIAHLLEASAEAHVHASAERVHAHATAAEAIIHIEEIFKGIFAVEELPEHIICILEAEAARAASEASTHATHAGPKVERLVGEALSTAARLTSC